MAYCGPRGIPYRHFQGGPPGWDDWSRDAAMAWQADQADWCGSCGTRRSSWLDDTGMELRHPPAEVETALCGGCRALGRWGDQQPQKDPRALHGRYPRFRAPRTASPT